jgi:hypothetical protein
VIEPLPIIRWKSLWFGILVLAFIAWAWLRSATHRDEFVCTRPTTIYAVESEGSVISFTILPVTKVIAAECAFRSETRWDSNLSYFPRPFIQIHDGPTHILWLAYWLLALSILLPWAAFLTWRSQRMNRRAISKT